VTPDRNRIPMRIPARFRGPPGSAHGGYTCGLVAGLLGAGPTRVSVRAPTPLDTELEVVRADDRVEVRAGSQVVAEGERAELDLEAPEPVDLARAAEASEAGYDRWSAEHPFPGCFACGPARQPGDGLRLFPGSLEDGRFAMPWKPDTGLADSEGRVEPEYVWAALDCPTSAPVATFGGPVAVMAQLHARIEGPVRAGAPHAIISWPLTVEGRKRHAACAIFDADGRALALSRALWIELRD
jgi:hypothetical protein